MNTSSVNPESWPLLKQLKNLMIDPNHKLEPIEDQEEKRKLKLLDQHATTTSPETAIPSPTKVQFPVKVNSELANINQVKGNQ